MSKRQRVLLGLFLIFIAVLFSITPVQASEVSLQGEIIQGRFLVPIRGIFEALGADVAWDGHTNTVTGKRGHTTVILTIDSNLARVNGDHIQLDVPATLINGRTFGPLRFISEALGADVKWNEEDRVATITQAGTVIVVELLPVFELPDTVMQGELVAFYARHLPRGGMPVMELHLDHPLQYYPYKEGYVAYMPTHYGTTPGEYRIAYGLEGEPLQESILTVKARDFHIQHLTVHGSIVASTRNEAAYAQFSRYFPKARESSADERYYDQPFLLPVSGRLTTEFGQTRYVNNAPTSSRHSGLDIAAPTGTPVSATNRGRVTLSMNLILTGNTIVIDHGQGLFSVYYHMHQLFVEEGELVERGKTIGTVGSTGFSTGPHLHFTMSYYDHNLEPGYFLVGEPITYKNAHRHL